MQVRSLSSKLAAPGQFVRGGDAAEGLCPLCAGRNGDAGEDVQLRVQVGRGTTGYAYAGNVMTVTDPAGKWKQFENDVEGHLVKVTEPNPAGGSWDTTTSVR